MKGPKRRQKCHLPANPRQPRLHPRVSAFRSKSKSLPRLQAHKTKPLRRHPRNLFSIPNRGLVPLKSLMRDLLLMLEVTVITTVIGIGIEIGKGSEIKTATATVTVTGIVTVTESGIGNGSVSGNETVIERGIGNIEKGIAAMITMTTMATIMIESLPIGTREIQESPETQIISEKGNIETPEIFGTYETSETRGTHES